jgi:hypothetical protein
MSLHLSDEESVLHINQDWFSIFISLIIQDGIVYSFIVKDSSYNVGNFLEVDEAVEQLMFSPSYKMLLIQTEKVC